MLHNTYIPTHSHNNLTHFVRTQIATPSLIIGVFTRGRGSSRHIEHTRALAHIDDSVADDDDDNTANRPKDADTVFPVTCD